MAVEKPNKLDKLERVQARARRAKHITTALEARILEGLFLPGPGGVAMPVAPTDPDTPPSLNVMLGSAVVATFDPDERVQAEKMVKALNDVITPIRDKAAADAEAEIKALLA